jgi:hypothetical protein
LLDCIIHPSHRTFGNKRLWKKIEDFLSVITFLNWIPNNIGPEILSWSVFFQSVECFSNKVLSWRHVCEVKSLLESEVCSPHGSFNAGNCDPSCSLFFFLGFCGLEVPQKYHEAYIYIRYSALLFSQKFLSSLQVVNDHWLAKLWEANVPSHNSWGP